MTAVGWIGAWLLAVGLAIISVELALLTPRVLRLQRKAVLLRTVLEREAEAGGLELQRLQVLLDEIDFRLRPYRRVRRLLVHPLALALLESYRRRRSKK